MQLDLDTSCEMDAKQALNHEAQAAPPNHVR
jgi:hypothetical protein